MKCPRCEIALDTATHKGARVLHCANCLGFAVTIELVRRLAAKPRVDAIWRQACDPARRGTLQCPECGQSFTRATTPHGDADVALDVCHHCHIVWFDAGELEGIERKRVAPVVGAAAALHEGEELPSPPGELWRMLGKLETLFA